MSENNEKKVLLSLRNVEVKFNVRGRILTAIRNVSLDIYENESLAIVGESGSGKSVLTKTFAGMLETNGFIPSGSIIFSDDEISKTEVKMDEKNRKTYEKALAMLNKHSVLERGASEFNQMNEVNNNETNSLQEKRLHEFLHTIDQPIEDMEYDIYDYINPRSNASSMISMLIDGIENNRIIKKDRQRVHPLLMFKRMRCRFFYDVSMTWSARS